MVLLTQEKHVMMEA
jgi:hypothetical protein